MANESAVSTDTSAVRYGLRRLVLTLFFLGLIASNVASVMSSAFNELLGGIFEVAGLVTAYHLLKADNLRLRNSLSRQQLTEQKLRDAVKQYRSAIGQYKSAVSIQRQVVRSKSAALGRSAEALRQASAKLESKSRTVAKLEKRLALAKVRASRVRTAGGRISDRTFRAAKIEIARLPAEGDTGARRCGSVCWGCL